MGAGPSPEEQPLAVPTLTWSDFTFRVPSPACVQGDENRAPAYLPRADDILIMRDVTGKGILSGQATRFGPGDAYDEDDLVSVLSDLTDLDELERSVRSLFRRDT